MISLNPLIRMQKLPLQVLLAMTFFVTVAQAAPHHIEWLRYLAIQMESPTFTRKDAEAYMEHHTNLFESAAFEDTHPAYTGCEHLLRVQVKLTPSAQPLLADVENHFGVAKEVPRAPDDFSSGEFYAFYPSAKTHEVFVRIFAEMDTSSKRILGFSIDREKPCS